MKAVAGKHFVAIIMALIVLMMGAYIILQYRYKEKLGRQQFQYREITSQNERLQYELNELLNYYSRITFKAAQSFQDNPSATQQDLYKLESYLLMDGKGIEKLSVSSKDIRLDYLEYTIQDIQRGHPPVVFIAQAVRPGSYPVHIFQAKAGNRFIQTEINSLKLLEAIGFEPVKNNIRTAIRDVQSQRLLGGQLSVFNENATVIPVFFTGGTLEIAAIPDNTATPFRLGKIAGVIPWLVVILLAVLTYTALTVIRTYHYKKNRYQCLYANSLTGMIEIDIRSGRILNSNLQSALLLGYDREAELLEKENSLYPYIQDDQQREKFVEQLVNGGLVKYFPVVLKNRKNLQTNVLLFANAFSNYHAVCNLVEVSGYLAPGNTLEKSIDELNFIFDSIPAAILLIDQSDRITSTNMSAQVILDKTSGDLHGKKPSEVFPAFLADQIRREDQEVLLQGKTIIDSEYSFQLPGKVKKYFLTSKLPRFTPDGKISGILYFMVDITVRKTYETELENREKELETLHQDTSILVEQETRKRVIAAQLEFYRAKCRELAFAFETVSSFSLTTCTALKIAFEEIKEESGKDKLRHMDQLVEEAIHKIESIDEKVATLAKVLTPSKSRSNFSPYQMLLEIKNLLMPVFQTGNIIIDVTPVNNQSPAAVTLYNYQSEFRQAMLNILTHCLNRITAVNNSGRNTPVKIKLFLQHLNIHIVFKYTSGRVENIPEIITDSDQPNIALYTANILVRHILNGTLKGESAEGSVTYTVTLPAVTL